MQVQPLGQEDTLVEGTATHSVFLPGKSVDRGAWLATVHVVPKTQTQLSDKACSNTWRKLISRSTVIED